MKICVFLLFSNLPKLTEKNRDYIIEVVLFFNFFKLILDGFIKMKCKKNPLQSAIIIHFPQIEVRAENYCDLEEGISRQLMALGISVEGSCFIKDEDLLEKIIIDRLPKIDLFIIISGQIQKVVLKAVKKITGQKIDFNPSSPQIPQFVHVLENTKSNSPGYILEHQQKIFLCLPEDPSSFTPIIAQGFSYIKSSFHLSTDSPNVLIFRTCSLSEKQIQAKLSNLIHQEKINKSDISFLPLHHLHGIDVIVKAGFDPDVSSRIKKEVRNQLGEDLYGEQFQKMEEVVGDLLNRHHYTLATAESCTGGLIADRLTDVPGSSKYFLQGIITYSNAAKQSLLTVNEGTLREFGAVSREVVREMCLGIKQQSQADVAMATSGIAGPGGGSISKPVGLVYIGVYDGQEALIKELHLQGSRRMIKYQTSQLAMDLLRRYLLHFPCEGLDENDEG